MRHREKKESYFYLLLYEYFAYTIVITYISINKVVIFNMQDKKISSNFLILIYYKKNKLLILIINYYLLNIIQILYINITYKIRN